MLNYKLIASFAIFTMSLANIATANPIVGVENTTGFTAQSSKTQVYPSTKTQVKQDLRSQKRQDMQALRSQKRQVKQDLRSIKQRIECSKKGGTWDLDGTNRCVITPLTDQKKELVTRNKQREGDYIPNH